MYKTHTFESNILFKHILFGEDLGTNIPGRFLAVLSRLWTKPGLPACVQPIDLTLCFMTKEFFPKLIPRNN